jgi:hypothetical protein
VFSRACDRCHIATAALCRAEQIGLGSVPSYRPRELEKACAAQQIERSHTHTYVRYIRQACAGNIGFPRRMLAFCAGWERSSRPFRPETLSSFAPTTAPRKATSNLPKLPLGRAVRAEQDGAGAPQVVTASPQPPKSIRHSKKGRLQVARQPQNAAFCKMHSLRFLFQVLLITSATSFRFEVNRMLL